MISAFGIEHTIEKSLKPNHIAALKNASADYSTQNWRKQMYAHSRLGLHSISENGSIAQRMDISRGMYKKPLGRLTRVKRNVRDKNRKPIFGNPEVAKSFLPGGVPKAARELSDVERRGMKINLQNKKQAGSANPIPGLGKLSGFSTTKAKSQGPFYAQKAGKELRRLRRVREGKQVSPVRGSWRP